MARASPPVGHRAKCLMSGGRGLPKPRHTHATTPVSRKHPFSSAKLHVSMFLDDIVNCHDVPMTLTGVFTTLLDIPIATLVGEIQFWVSVSLELHAVARPPVCDSFVPAFGRLLPYLSIRFNSNLYFFQFKWSLLPHCYIWNTESTKDKWKLQQNDTTCLLPVMKFELTQN